MLGRSRRPATKKEENPRPPQAFRRRPDARHAPCAGWKKRARPKGRATGTKGTKHPAPRRNPAVPYDLQAGSESIGVDWLPLPCACERSSCLPVPIIRLRKRKRGMARRRSPPVGAEAPTPPGRSSCALRGVEKACTPKRTRRQGQRARSIQQPAANPGMPYDLQARSESIGVDWSPLPCACERTTCLPVPIIQLRKRKRGLALPYAAQQRGNRRLPFNPHHRPHTGN